MRLQLPNKSMSENRGRADMLCLLIHGRFVPEADMDALGCRFDMPLWLIRHANAQIKRAPAPRRAGVRKLLGLVSSNLPEEPYSQLSVP
jgi:hypothetical protein